MMRRRLTRGAPDGASLIDIEFHGRDPHIAIARTHRQEAARERLAFLRAHRRGQVHPDLAYDFAAWDGVTIG